VKSVAVSDLIKLEAESRKDTGKQAAKRLRADGLTPGIIYGLKKAPEAIAIQGRVLAKALQDAAGKSLIELKVGRRKGHPVMIAEVQREPVTREVIHIDFKRIDLKKTSRFTVPIEFVGEASGIREGGVLNAIEDSVEIECLPTDLPSKIEANISELDIGDALYARDLVLPEGTVLKVEPDIMIVNIGAPVAEEVVEVPAEVAEVAEGEEVPEGEEVAEKPEEKPEGEAPDKPKES
jgi:large subunit ribosomal protein L25